MACSKLNCKDVLKSNALLLLTLVGVGAGFALGFGLRDLEPSDEAKVWIGLFGEIFLRLLKMMILPLIVSSVISGTASLDPKSNGKISLIALGYIIVTNLIGCMLGIILAVTIKPGQLQVGLNASSSVPNTGNLKTPDIFADLIRNIFPDNLITACFQKVNNYSVWQKTERLIDVLRHTQDYFPYMATLPGLVGEETGLIAQRKPPTFGEYLSQTKYSLMVVNNETVSIRRVGTAGGSNIIGIIFCAVLLGIATSSSGESGRPFRQFFKSAMEVILKLLRWFLWFTPVGVASLIAVSVLNVDDLQVRFLQLARLILAVTVGLLFQEIVMIPAVYMACFLSNPFRYLVNVFPAWSISFASTSTAVAIPEMVQCCEAGHGVDKRVSRFVIPFSVTLGASGSALFITASAIFIGQLNQIDVNASQLIIIGILTAVSVMALPAVPSASIVVIIIILETLGFPVEDVALLLAVEWFLDRMRSSCNVVTHTFSALFVYRFCKNGLPPLKSTEAEIEVEAFENHYVNPNVNISEKPKGSSQERINFQSNPIEEFTKL